MRAKKRLKWNYALLLVIMSNFLLVSSLRANNFSVSIPFDVVKGLIVIELNVESKSRNFVLDTGSDAILINKFSKNTTHYFETIYGAVASQKEIISSISIGQHIKSNVSAYSMELSSLENFLNIDLYGIIGVKFFVPNTIYFDFENNIMHISDSDISTMPVSEMSSCKINFVDDLPMIEVDIGGKSYNFILDSGASTHLIDPSLISEFPTLFTEDLKNRVNMVSASKEIEPKSRWGCSKLQINKTEIYNISFVQNSFDDINKELSNPVKGLISLNRLRGKKLILDIKNKRLYF